MVSSDRNMQVQQIERIYIICAFCWVFFDNYTIMHGVERIILTEFIRQLFAKL